ncbi:MAG TPA: type II secretion system protein [Candidatus Saccharibacteria bacterium]|nr:type II secretion system protein [Candidatus Saccharibacteria bacterium]HRQ06987.1 type II secretion system protein [Candidatus Saccharibacteria bacterium]
MSISRNAGFTIIETMLFLGISGLLVVALLVGTGASINTQRYRDSVSTFMAFLQQQYSDVNNVSNDRSGDWSCGSDGAQTKQGGSSVVPRGQSDCFIAGRFIMVDKDGGITTLPVTGLQTGTAEGSDVSMLTDNYAFDLSTVGEEKSSLEWGAKLSWPVADAGPSTKPAGTPRAIWILIIRSPDSGSVYTFTYDPSTDTDTPIENITSDFIKNQIMKPSGSQSRRTICIDSASGVAPGSKLAVFISDNASNASAIETRSYQTILSMGGGPKC